MWAVKEATEESEGKLRYQELELDASEDSYVSPVIYAIDMGRTEIAKYLIDKGYSINNDNNNAIKTAVRFRNIEIINKLLEKDHNLVNVAFLHSVSRSNIELVKMFLDRGADVHFRDEKPLTNAIGRQNDEIIRLLLDRGADLYKAEQRCTIIGKNYAKKFYKDNIFTKLRNFKMFGTNEGLRDKMTPKPTEDVRNGLYDYFKENKVMNQNEYVKEVDVFDNLNDLYLILDYEEYYDIVDRYFKTLTDGEDKFEMTIYGDRYVCYPKQKLVDYCDNTMTGGWYFGGEKLDSVIEYIINNW